MNDFEIKTNEFKQYLLLERKYSQNTANSYIEDLKEFTAKGKNRQFGRSFTNSLSHIKE